MREIRYLDKLIDELAKGKAMIKIPRQIAACALQTRSPWTAAWRGGAVIINSASMSWQTTVLVLSNIGRTGQKNCRSRRCKDVRFPAENGMPLRLSSWHSRPLDQCPLLYRNEIRSCGGLPRLGAADAFRGGHRDTCDQHDTPDTSPPLPLSSLRALGENRDLGIAEKVLCCSKGGGRRSLVLGPVFTSSPFARISDVQPIGAALRSIDCLGRSERRQARGSCRSSHAAAFWSTTPNT